MSYCIPSSTEILTLTTVPFLFISVGALSICEFSMVQGVYILLWPKRKRYTLRAQGHRYTHSAAQSLKRFKPFSVTILLWQGHYKEFNCVCGLHCISVWNVVTSYKKI